MRDAFVRTVLTMAKADPRIVLLTGDLGFGVLTPFWEALPNQFINTGIAEQNMTSAAAGMAMAGKTVVTYSIGNFPTSRCLEQIRNDCAYHGTNVKIVCVGGGFTYGALGMSHHATEDIAMMRALPDVTVFAPGDAAEAEGATKAMLQQPGTCYLRLGRGGEMPIPRANVDFTPGKAIPVYHGEQVALLSTGAIFDEVYTAAQLLRGAGIHPTVYTFPTVKPLDAEAVRACSNTHALVVTCEEHSIVGGFGSAVAEVMAEHPGKARLLRMGIPDRWCRIVGDQKYLRQQCGLTGQQMAQRILEALKWKNGF